MRNSSLVEWLCAENVTGLSVVPKLRVVRLWRAAVEERSIQGRIPTVRTGGPDGSDHAGISNDKEGENPSRRKSKVSVAR